MGGLTSPPWCVFFDRDGTLNHNVPRGRSRSSPRTPGEWRFVPGVRAALSRLRAEGARLAIVTNQPDLSRGLLDEHALDLLHSRFTGERRVDRIYVCPHTSADGCPCRKPSSHWFHCAATQLGVSLADSFVVGDRPTDAQAGLNAGLRAVLIGAVDQVSDVPGLSYATDLSSAVTSILSQRRDSYVNNKWKEPAR